jgi:predicted alpha/beta-hydrolase family hydrolase
MAIEFLSDGPADAATTLILAHGAGAAMDTPFMDYFAKRLAEAGLRVLRFEFPYMARRRDDGKKRGPDKPEVLMATWHEAITASGSPRPVIGGKSMGGRIGSMVADEAGVAGLVCLGYPFHPPGAPDKTRTAHLAELRTPALIVQGTKDSFGTKEDVAGYKLSDNIAFQWIDGGNHDLRAPGLKQAETWGTALAAIERFIAELG